MEFVMRRQVEAVYEHGVLRPLEPVSLAEAQHVSLTISDPAAGPSRQDLDVVERARAEVAGLDKIPTIEEVRSALASIPGSLSQDIVAERGEY